jgi:selenocysteine-specific elongation factor
MSQTSNQKHSRHVILGTAGHIDHGKTMLIKAITGVDTDRLAEEKRRGISIDLGFAEMRLPTGRILGVVDVPGHERFVKNMLAGASGIDIVLLVVAADDGVMPQTEEHLAIIDLLGVSRGIVAITKADLVDEEWLTTVEEDVRRALQGTSLAGAPILAVSSIAGKGIPELLSKLEELTDEVIERDTGLPFRLPIDRVFTLKGAGTVVTGTLWSGRVSPETQAEILPKGLSVRIRSVQVHGKPAEEAYAGQRVALNLAGVKPSDLERGDVVLEPGSLTASMMFDAHFRLLSSAKNLRNRARVRVHHGTHEVMGRVVLLDREELLPGEDAFVQLRLESAVVPRYKDRFIVRSYSPAHTVGGGEVLLSHPLKHRRKERLVVEELEILRRGNPLEVVGLALKEKPLSESELARRCEIQTQMVRDGLKALLAVKEVTALKSEGEEIFWLSSSFDRLKELIVSWLREYHKANPLSPGVSRETLRQKQMKLLPARVADAALAFMAREGLVRVQGETVSLAEAGPRLTEEQKALVANLEGELLGRKFSPPSPEELVGEFNQKPQEIKALLNVLISQGTVVAVKQGLYFHREALTEIEEKLREFLQKSGKMTVSQFRDLIDTSRKYAVPLLEYFDSKKLTRREGDFRVLR